MRTGATLLIILLGVAGCRVSDSDSEEQASEDQAQQDARVATAFASGSARMSAEELEAARMNMGWREFVERDTIAAGDSGAPGVNESWDDITMESVNSGPIALPVHGDVAGPSVLRVQIVLDRALFSPGVIDGRWGSNTEKAVYWLQRREGLRASGHVDQPTWQRLQQLAGQPAQLVRTRQLTAEDVAGPFVTLPEEYYERRDMECQCYESLAEKLAELSHTTEELLEKLNPGVDLNSMQAGMQLNVPAVERQERATLAATTPARDNDQTRGPSAAAGQDGSAQGGSPAAGQPGSSASGARASRDTSADGAAAGQGVNGTVAKIVISDGGRYLHALDGAGRILYHFPATLGSDYSPSPSGDYRITNIAHDPSWHYQPDLLEGVDDEKPDAVLPAGPNNAVGVVWMQLSRPHYGIHGTSAPETIGYATSNGCVRLTNWDAEFLASHTDPGTPVEFRDVAR
ncbi:MAG TPA: L,D-transpeptidase family protein [Longimicrobiales bacterium]|nr:L,D-transpeptidase family protein [Longimicrobiales bacterium]